LNCIFIVFKKYQEGIDALEEVIYHVETYDVTTIRASTPMFLMSRKIKSLGVKMVISGEGSDFWWLPLFSQGTKQERIP
jgi:asparagine synthetase B (glutamine-hydrolysing)